MSASTGERFVRSRGAPIKVGPWTVEMMLERHVANGDRLLVRFLSTKSVPVQGLRLKVDSGHMLVMGQRLTSMDLWTDTAPDCTELVFETAEPTTFKAWNIWRNQSYGHADAWIGNSGMVIERADESVTIRASDVQGEFDPSDLVVELVFGQPSTNEQ